MGWSQLLANWIGDSCCAGGGSPCTLTKCPVLSCDGMQHWSAMCGSHGVVWKYCHAQHQRGSRWSVMVHLVHFVCMPLTISDHLQLHPPTLWFHIDTHCTSLHNHATPVAGLNSDQCLISPDFVPMSRAATYLSFSPYATFA